MDRLKLEKTIDFKYPPTRNRAGRTRSPNDIKTLMVYKTDLVRSRTIFTSDLHSHSVAVFEDLKDHLELSQYDLYTVGDMSGDMVFGSDGDSTPFYAYVKSKVRNLYIIQGNHDLPPPNINDLLKLRNNNNTQCYLSDGLVTVKTDLGNVGCVHGTISLKTHPYKKDDAHYYALLDHVLSKKPDFLFTHETPEIKYKENGHETTLIGKPELFQKVVKAKQPVHVYGHCHHHRPLYQIESTLFINVDGRIVVLEPTGN